MTDDQIHKEVLKVMGWVCVDESKEFGPLWWRKGNDIQSWPTESLPPLTLDLMWQAEEMLDLNGKDVFNYTKELWIAMDCSKEAHFGTIHATAIQRARAFLKVKGKL